LGFKLFAIKKLRSTAKKGAIRTIDKIGFHSVMNMG
jgi:hypothetical protein